MIKQTPWLERTFKGPSDPGLYPCTIERVRGLDLRISNLTAGVPEKSLAYKPNGKWSIKEQIGHLWAVDDLHLTRLHELKNGIKTFTPADMSNRKTDQAKFNDRSLGEIIEQVRIRRAEMMALLDGVEDELITRSAYHERLKVHYSWHDLAHFIAEHDEHHLAMIRRLVVEQL